MTAFVEIERVGKRYGGAHVVRGFDLEMQRGELVSLIGPSGCGKSTVLSIVAGLTRADAGRVRVAGREIDRAGPDRAVVFQAPSLLPWLSARENVRLGISRAPDSRAVADAELSAVGLAGAEERKPAALSRGMQQRVSIARAMALRPAVLLLDEPFGALDSITRAELQESMGRLHRERGQTTLLVTHDVDEALLLSDRVVMMTRGPDAKVGGVLERPFAHDARAQLLAFLDAQAATFD
jgi:nitrate/nitrite transport system ATP-binding protein